MENQKYYFAMYIDVDQSYNLDNIEKDFGFEPTYIRMAKQYTNHTITEHLIEFRTPLQDNSSPQEHFTSFLKEKIVPIAPKIKKYASENEVCEVYFCIVFNNDKIDNQGLGLEAEAIKILADLGASWYID